jgi:hypothetical protein
MSILEKYFDNVSIAKPRRQFAACVIKAGCLFGDSFDCLLPQLGWRVRFDRQEQTFHNARPVLNQKQRYRGFRFCYGEQQQ